MAPVAFPRFPRAFISPCKELSLRDIHALGWCSSYQRRTRNGVALQVGGASDAVMQVIMVHWHSCLQHERENLTTGTTDRERRGTL